MKIKISKTTLLDLLSKTQNIAEKKVTMPVLINVLLKAQNDKLKIFATDLEVSLTDEGSVEVIEEGEIAVNTKQIYEITRELNEGDITLEVMSKKEGFPSRLHIEQEKSVFNIVCIESSKFPVFPKPKNEKFVELDKRVFIEMIDCTIHSVSNDETRYHLNGVFFENKKIDGKNNLRMVSTDSHRLSFIDRLTNVEKLKLGVIVPKKGLIEVRKVIDSSIEPVFISIEGSQFVLKTGKIILMIRLIEGKYPDYERFIPEKISKRKEKCILVDREIFLGLIKRVSLFSNQKSKEITFKFSEGKMEIMSNDPKIGDAREELEIDYSDKEFEIGFNARYIIDVLSSFSEDNFLFLLKDEFSPGVIKPEKDKNYTYVIMPIRL